MEKPKLFGGLFLENVINKDKYFHNQLVLFDRGLIQGVQIRIAHPFFTPDSSLNEIIAILSSLISKGFSMSFHIGSENVGVDFGESQDEKRVYAKLGKPIGKSWSVWNEETVNWTMEIASLMGEGNVENIVVHPGYLISLKDEAAWERIFKALPKLAAQGVSIENVPPVVRRKDGTWNKEGFWGAGGTPDKMSEMLKSAPGLSCLIDFTHLFVAHNQATLLEWPELQSLADIDEAVRSFMALEHSSICHFSGLPPTFMDNHSYLGAEPCPAVKQALSQHEIICLEIDFSDAEEVERQIRLFKQAYDF